MTTSERSSANVYKWLMGLSMVALLGILTIACASAPAREDFAADTRVASGSAAALDPVLQEIAALLPAPEAGVAVAIVEGDAVSIGFAGNLAFDEQTLFEFGSITKVMTALVLAQLAEEGSLQLTDPVNRYLPPEAQAPQWEAVTLRNLATHTAGIPRLPGNLNPFALALRGQLDDPYGGYDAALLYEGLADTEVEGPAGEAAYSNLGFGLLGTLLSEHTGQSYAELIGQRIFEPFGMTTATIDGWSGSDIAPPLDDGGEAVGNWTFDAFAGAGAAKGSLRDAIAFLRAGMTACAPESDSPAARANCLAQQPAGIPLPPESEMGLGWIRTNGEAGTAVWHNGGTGGYRTFLGFNPERQTGIVLLSNVGGLDEVDRLGLGYLTGAE